MKRDTTILINVVSSPPNYFNGHINDNWFVYNMTTVDGSRFLTCPCNKIYREEAVGLKSSDYISKIYDFCCHVKFGANS